MPNTPSRVPPASETAQSPDQDRWWRSLEELAECEEPPELVRREFPQGAEQWGDPLSRRRFLSLMGASLALAGLQGCSRAPQEKIVPYVRAPKDFVPGKPLFYASAFDLGGRSLGLLVESHMGRPTKVEGNPQHPSSAPVVVNRQPVDPRSPQAGQEQFISFGATDVMAQAAPLGLYDPDRSQTVMDHGQVSTFGAFVKALGGALKAQESKQGAGLRILTSAVTSPTLTRQLQAVLEKYPQAQWVQYEAINDDNVHAGARLAFGETVEPIYHLDKADVILALDADFLGPGPDQVRHTRQFANRRLRPAAKRRARRT